MKKIKSLSSLSIGSVPFLSTEEAINSILTIDVPASPQMVKISPWEDSLLSATYGLPTIKVENKKIISKKENRENELVSFYEKILNNDFNFLALGESSNLGWQSFIKKAKEDKNFGKNFLKAQIVGPLTFGQAVEVEGAYKLVDDPELLEMISQAFASKAILLAKEIQKLNRNAIIFLDEPGLTGYGSAFSSLSEEMVLKTLQYTTSLIQKKTNALVGCHVCGNTDWALLLKTGINIINLDAYNFAENFILYPKEILNFLKQDENRYIAWGIVPTQEFNKQTNSKFLSEKLKDIWQKLANKGLDLELIKERSLLSSACGLGTLSIENALSINVTTTEISKILKNNI